MEGPQSDGDRAEYKMQAGRVADRSLPTEQRIAAAQEVQKLQNKYLSLNGGAANTGGASGSFDDKPAAPKSSFSQSGYQNEAAAIKDAQNAILRGASRQAVQKRLESMGLSLPNGAQGSF